LSTGDKLTHSSSSFEEEEGREEGEGGMGRGASVASIASRAASAAALAASRDFLGLAKRRGRECVLLFWVLLVVMDVEGEGWRKEEEEEEEKEEGGREEGRWKDCERRGRERAVMAAVARRTRKEEDEDEDEEGREETGRGLLLLLVMCADGAVGICVCRREGA